MTDIQPQPVPTSVALGKTADGKFNVFQFTTPLGTFVFFLDDETSRKMGDALVKQTSPIALVQSLADVMVKQ